MFPNCHEVFLRLRWLALMGLCGAALSAEAEWFTIAGEPNTEATDTVQVDPVALQTDGDTKTMSVRVSRSGLRHNWEGLPYRSYEARALFDCRAMKADYLYVAYYMQPQWKGQPYLLTDYANNRRPMLFRDMAPNPTARIVRAACRQEGVRD